MGRVKTTQTVLITDGADTVYGYIYKLYRGDLFFHQWPHSIETVRPYGEWAKDWEGSPMLSLPKDYRIFYLKTSGLAGNSGPYFFKQEEIEKAVHGYVSPVNEAGGNACSVALRGNEIVLYESPGYGTASLLESVSEMWGSELLKNLLPNGWEEREGTIIPL